MRFCTFVQFCLKMSLDAILLFLFKFDFGRFSYLLSACVDYHVHVDLLTSGLVPTAQVICVILLSVAVDCVVMYV